MLPLKRSFVYALIANAIAGAYLGVTQVVNHRTGGLGIFSIFNTIDPDGTISMNFWNVIIGFVIAIAVGFILQMVMPVPRLEAESVDEARETSADETGIATADEMRESAKQEIIGSPLAGELVTQNDIKDQVFASGAMGKAIAVNPTEGAVYAPANATVTTIFPTGHAIGLTTDNGTEILIHIGLDTVELNGEGFEKLVATGDQVAAGQKLITFDMDLIQERGFSTQTPIVITNTAELEDVLFTGETTVTPGDYLLTVVR